MRLLKFKNIPVSQEMFATNFCAIVWLQMKAQTSIKGVAALVILVLLSAVKQTSIGACDL